MERKEFDLKIRNNKLKRECFIKDNIPFIRQVACSVCKRPLFWEIDDELSIALISFDEAIDNYDQNKGAYHSFAGMIIKRRLVDYFRKERRNSAISIDDLEEAETHPYEIKSAQEEHQLRENQQIRSFAIAKFDEILSKYGLNFSSLVLHSPKHIDTRIDLIRGVKKLSETNKDLLNGILATGKVSATKISRASNLTHKQVKSWKNYILALIIVFNYEELSAIKDFLALTKAGEQSERKDNGSGN